MQPLNSLEKELLRQWLRKADGDLRVAERLADAPEDYDAVAFHCQQAAEKYLKARLAATGEDPPRTHDLLRLLQMLQQVESFTALEMTMAKLLTPFGVAIRYPGEDEEPPVADLLIAARHFRDKLRSTIEAELL
ncbi:HEPN domain-containing protein [Hymenobacter humi]|uniref:HEPN domain-containing protein n=1 Tax=Hymenobacter humi TaxID=1411620 RepID=A0ABW2U3Q4_9BACT